MLSGQMTTSTKLRTLHLCPTAPAPVGYSTTTHTQLLCKGYLLCGGGSRVAGTMPDVVIDSAITQAVQCHSSAPLTHPYTPP